MRFALSVLAGLLASAAALDPSTCAASSTLTPTTTWTCATVTFSNPTANTNVSSPLTIEVPLDSYLQRDVQVLVWNIDETLTGAWAVNPIAFRLEDQYRIQYTGWTDYMSPTGLAAPHPASVIYALALTLNQACPGPYTFQIYGSLVNGDLGRVGIAIRYANEIGSTSDSVAQMPGQMTPSMPTLSVQDELLPGMNVGFMLNAPFVQYLYMVKEVAVNVVLSSANQVPQPFDGSDNGVPVAFLSNDFVPEVTNVTASGATSTTSFVRVNKPTTSTGTAGSTMLGFTVPTLQDLYESTNRTRIYSWRTVGPFFDLSVVLAGITEYPTLFDFRSGAMPMADQMINITANSGSQYQIYQIILDPLWWNTTFFVSNVVDRNNSLPLTHRSVAVTVANGSPATAQGTSTGFSGVPDPRTFTFYNPTFFTFNGGSPNSANAAVSMPNSLSPLSFAFPVRFFVKVTAGSTCPATAGLLSYAITAASRTIANECRSYADCLKKSDHPSEGRKDDSSNKDASRFTHCGIFNTGGPGMLTPTTKCYECATNADCEEGQYCHVDNSVIDSDQISNRYIVDGVSYSYVGLCRTKSKSVLGQRCRSLTSSENANVFSTASTQLNTGVTAGSHEKFADNNGFCGDVLLWNATADSSFNLNANAANRFNVGGTVRAVLWTGACLNNICMECSPAGYATQGGTVAGRTCVNGRIVDVKDVDFTVRTLTHNSMGGILLAIMCFLITVMTCFGFSMMSDANRHREFFGDGPMTTKDVCRAIFCTSLPCCKVTSPIKSRQPSVVATSAQMHAAGHSVTNPLGATAPAY